MVGMVHKMVLYRHDICVCDHGRPMPYLLIIIDSFSEFEVDYLVLTGSKPLPAYCVYFPTMAFQPDYTVVLSVERLS